MLDKSYDACFFFALPKLKPYQLSASASLFAHPLPLEDLHLALNPIAENRVKTFDVTLAIVVVRQAGWGPNLLAACLDAGTVFGRH